jgi:hypothetical protein
VRAIFRPVPTPLGFLRRVEPLAAALALGVLAHLPIGVWIGAREKVEPLPPLWSRWGLGIAIAVAIGTVVALIARPGTSRGDALARGWRSAAGAAESRSLRFGFAAALVAAYAALGRWVFSGRPLLIDEVVQVLQARLFEQGRLWRPVAAEPAFESLMLVVDMAGKWFGQFPPGWSLLLAPFDAAGVSWMAAPVLGGAAVLAYGAWLRATEADVSTRFAALLLFATAPFFAFFAASHMNHVPTLAFCLGGAAAAARVARAVALPEVDRPAAWRFALLSGLAFGAAATIRPVDALAWCLPAGVWVLVATWRVRGLRFACVAFAAGALVPVSGLLWYNAATTGQPLLFGYEYLWGPTHGLGFHDAPWGPPHTPNRALALVHMAYLRLQTYGFEGLLPAVSVAVATLALWPRFSASDRMLAGAALCTTLAYFFYWHDGFFLGPRLYLGAWPFVVTFVARLPLALSRQFPQQPALAMGAAAALVASPLVGWPSNLPFRMMQYSSGFLSMRVDADSAAAHAGAAGDLVFVREPWGARVISRLWALGVPRSDAERLYRSVDLCRLDLESDSLRHAGLRDSALTFALRPLTADSGKLVATQVGGDPTTMVLPGAAYPERCRRAALEAAAGSTPMAPLLLGRGPTRFVRSMGADDTLLLAREPNRRAWMVYADTAPGSPPRFFPLNRDSVWRAARGSMP